MRIFAKRGYTGRETAEDGDPRGRLHAEMMDGPVMVLKRRCWARERFAGETFPVRAAVNSRGDTTNLIQKSSPIFHQIFHKSS